MKDYSENQENPYMDVRNEKRSMESYQEELVHSDNALKGLVPQQGSHFNPFDEKEDEQEEAIDDDELDDDDMDNDDMAVDIDQRINNEDDNEGPDGTEKGDQSDIPPEFPYRGPDRNYTTHKLRNFLIK